MSLKKMKLTNNFNKTEFDCKCGCKMPEEVLSNAKLLAIQLQLIRDHSNAPIQINSAYRCPSHNKAIGGVSNSQHTLGRAADIVVKGQTPDDTVEMIEDMLADECLFPFHLGGIGRYNTFTHVDIRTNYARWDKRK
jgi:uncharacterized protein YcbK (DUF882 family)